MRRFVNEALREVSLLEEHVTTWMAEEPDPIESDPDGALTDRQRVLVFAGCIKGTLEAGVTSTETTGTDHSSDLAAAVGHVRELEGQVAAAEKRASEAESQADKIAAMAGERTREADSLRSKLAEAEAARAGDAHLLDEAMSDRDTAIEQRDLARSAVHGYRESCDEVHRLLTAAGVDGEDDAPVRVQRLIAERDGLLDKTRSQSSAAPAADRKVLGIDPARRCGECSKYRSDGYCADIDACVGGGDDVCGSFTRRMPETPAAAATCEECGNLFAGECVAMKCGPRYKHDPVCPRFVRRGEEVQP